MAYQSAIQFWKAFDLHNLQKQLDKEASEIAKKQDESDLSVKKLVELSRDFKKNSTEEVRKQVSPLLKAFQSEIDSLTKRGSSAETYFLNAYKKFIEIPDPIPLLEQAVNQHTRLMNMQDLVVENAKLRETLDEYTKEFAQVKNQETTISKLRNQIKELDNTVEERAKVKGAEISAQLKESFKEKERELKAALAAANNSTKEALAKNSLLQSALDSTQLELFELKNKLDDDSAARAAEMDILMTDLERANQRSQTAERELERLQSLTLQEQQQLKSSSDTTELELEIRSKDKELTCVRDDVERLQNSLITLKEQSTNQIRLLEERLKEKETRLSVAENMLSQQSDYEEIKKELSILRSVEFSTSQLHETTSSSKPLEVLLLEKNRGLVNENTGLKSELSELRAHFTSLEAQYKESLQDIERQQVLITQLEGDLARIQPFLPPRTEGEGQASPSDFIAEAVKDIHPDKKDNDSSLLSIVTNQRERFKHRNIELEAECQEQKQSITVLQREIDTLRADNIKMYEKVKFLQTYPTSAKRSNTDDSSVHRYSSQYEAGLDPFAAFSAKERQRKYMQLSGPDKATLVLGRFILSNKIARMVSFFYVIILHLIVMLVLAKLANTSTSATVDLYAECAKKFTEHMTAFHSIHELPHDTGGGGGGGGG